MAIRAGLRLIGPASDIQCPPHLTQISRTTRCDSVLFTASEGLKTEAFVSHPLQTSDALGVGQVQVGPDAIALASQLTKGLGLSHAKAAAVLRDGYGLTVSRSGLCRAIQRLGTKAAPTYDALVQATQTSLLIWIDETGWRVAGRLQWLWVAVSEQATVFKIQPGRGFFDEAATLLGADYEGFLHHDGWRSYYTFPRAFHQSCVAHIVRRCEELITRGSRAAAWFPQAVLDLVQRGLALRDRGEAGTITPHGLAVATGRLDAALGRLLARPVRTPEHRRLATHLDHERPHLFTFLHCPGVHATNNVAYAGRGIGDAMPRPGICRVGGGCALAASAGRALVFTDAAYSGGCLSGLAIASGRSLERSWLPSLRHLALVGAARAARERDCGASDRGHSLGRGRDSDPR
jgi:hypothetical protein